jgi:ParB family transcriptional regulator, chromosome partitioning protein
MITKLPIDRIRPDPDQPRKLFTQAEIEELAQSMRENGQLQAISVCADPERGSGYFMIAWGQRRYHAALHNAWTTISVEVVDMQEAEIRIAQIVENLQRQSMTPLEEAAAYQRELDGGMTIASLAGRLGLKQPWRITERTALLKLEPEYRGLLASGNLTPSQAFEMSRLSPRAQTTLFGAIKSGHCTSNSALRASAFALAEAEAQGPLFAPLPTEPTQTEIAASSRLERKIDAACEVLSAGFYENECVAARRVDPNKASLYAEKLSLMQRHLGQMERALRAAAVQYDFK